MLVLYQVRKSTTSCISYYVEFLQVASLANPPCKTNFQQKLKEKKESIYLSRREAPLGKSHDQTSRLPKGLDVTNTAFGITTLRGSKICIETN